MNSVFVYGFKGAFSGKAEYEYRFPQTGKFTKGIVFISQINDELDFDGAEKEIAKYGFIDIFELEGNILKIESLNSGGGIKFQPYYEEAIESGSSLAIY